MTYPYIIALALAIIIPCTVCDTFMIQALTSTVSTLSTYQTTLSFDNDITPVVGSSILITFPVEYNNRLSTASYTCVVDYWPYEPYPTPTCTIANSILTINNLFPSLYTFPAGYPFQISVQGILNPYSTQMTGDFALSMNLDSGGYSSTTTGVVCSTGAMTCTVSPSPTQVNNKGSLVVSFVAPEFPTGSTLKIQSNVYWEQGQPPMQQGTEIIQSASLTCSALNNANSGISCSFIQISGLYQISVSNVVSSTLNSTAISFKIASILSPPTTKPQGSFEITSYNNNAPMSQCTGITISSATAGTFTSGSFSSSSITVNSVGVGTLTFGISSNIVPTDTFIVAFPSTIGLTSLSNVYINNGGGTNSTRVSNQSITLTGATAYAGDVFSVVFTGVTNPPSEQLTTAFQITAYRIGFSIESSSSITYSAYRSLIATASLSSSSLQIGVSCTYTITFTLGQPLISSSAVVVGLPSQLQGKVGTCSPSPCTVTSTSVTFTSVSTTVGSSITLTLGSVINPYSLGTTTSLTLYTLYYSSISTSIVEYVNSGLTLSLIARASTAASATISPSSSVVNNYPTTYTITLTNLNPIPIYTYIVLYIPPEITMIGQIGCQSGTFVVSCTFDSGTKLLTLSALTSAVSAGQLVSSPFSLSNLINPSSTMPTTSFQVFYYNSNNLLIEYITSGLSIQMTTAANFAALSLTPNSTVNSALTSLSVSFNVPSASYQNNSYLVVTFPSAISLTNILCSMISSNILAITSCSIYSNTVKMMISFNSISTSTNTRLSLGPYNNYPSLQPYTIQVDLFGDSFQISKLCSNANSLTTLTNTQLGQVGISSYSFSNPTLLSSSNLVINIANVSSTSFSFFTLKFPPDFGHLSASCSAPAGISCGITLSQNLFNLTTASTFSLPFSITISNLITTAYTPSSYIYIQTFSASGYQMDQNSNVAFATTCTLPCKNCNTATPSVCTSCYSNTSLNQIGGYIYLNGSLCSSFCSSGSYLDNSTQTCLTCVSSCLTCSAYSTCLTCNSSFLFNSSCLATCPFSFYGFNFQCLSCPTSIFCQSCTDNFHCSSCIVGYYYYNQQCYLSCPSLITYPNTVNRTCDNCPQNCTNCAGNSTLVTCTVCNSGYVLDSTACYLSCVTAGTFAVNGICQGCSSTCKTCSVVYTNCTSCYLNATAPYLHNFICISVCPNGYYADNSSLSCVKCSSPCEYCSSSSIYSCQTCLSGYYLLNNTCLATCPSNYYNSSGSCLYCVSPCFTCTTELSCLSCTNSTYLYQSQCLAQCPSGMAVINGNECLVCPSTCKSCFTLTICTSCYNTSYLYNGTCSSLCPSTTFANTTSLTCDPCVSPCLACSSLTTCTSCADTTKFLVNSSCVSCNSPCLSCSLSISNCTSCITSSSTPYYLNYQCLTICPSNYYSDNTTYQCSLCVYPCLTCSGPTNSSCSSCSMGYYFLSNFCYLTCPSTYFSNVTLCTSCQSPCSTCSAPNVCLSCINTNYLSGSTCVTNCGTGMAVINNTICAFCSSSCQTCLSANSSACTSCYTTTYLYNAACSSTCLNAYYPDSISSQCLPCLSPCLNCNSATSCLSCADASLFLVNSTCVGCVSTCLTCSGLRTNCTSCDLNSSYPYLSSGSCISACPATYYPSITNTCDKCSSPCNSCLNSSTTYCLTCLSNYFQLGSLCYTNCPTGYFNNVTICSLCTSPCLTCSDASTCVSCITNYYLLGSTCVTNCSAGMAVINGNVCQYCSSSCQSCSSSNSSACTSCYNSTYLYGTACITNCPSTFYADSSSSKCLSCVGSCNTCQSSTFCLTCLDTSLFLVNGSCVGCTSPCITCNGTVTTCTSCSVTTGFSYLLSSSCLTTCPLTYYNQITLNSCVKCNSPCQTCTTASTSSCLTCLTGFLFLSSNCISSCPAAYYSNTTACLQCSSPCQNCYDSTTCTSCVNGTYLLGSNCVSNCTTGMILINNTYCQYCTGLCVTCLTSNSSYCTSCPSTLFLQWGSCSNICASGYYGNSSTALCSLCQSPCSTCLTDVLCLSCLDPTLFLLNNACVSCISPCLTCSVSRNNCTSCDQNSSFPLFMNNLCLASCPTGYYSSLFTCYRCNSPCDTCLGVSNTTCQSCVSGYVMFGSACVINCPSGYYSDSVSCVLCVNCSTCSSASVCLSCTTGLYLLGTSCVSSCPNGTISGSNSTGGVCSYCSSPCISCQTTNVSYCTYCPNNTYQSNGQCNSNCSAGYYPNTGLWVCSICVSPCSSCSSPTTCLSCLDPTAFLIGSTCVGCSSVCLTCSLTVSNCTSCNTSSSYPYLYGTTCLTTCPATFYNDNSLICKACASPCYTCSGAGNQTCLSCDIGYYQLNATCYTNCPSGYYNSINQCIACTSPCASCTESSNNTCTSCLSGLFLLGSVCVNNCSGLSVSGSTCLYCSSSCNTCLTNNNSYCTSCTSGLYLFSGTCISNCSSGYYPDSTALVCMVCINNCSTCTSSTACLTCKDSSLFLINTQCISCSSSCLTCSVTINNCTSCNASSAFPIFFGTECLSLCPTGYYNSTTTTCTLCSIPCSTCSSSGTSSCITCLQGYYYLSNICYTTCPATYFQNVTICSLCDASCYTCQSSAFTCVSCSSGKYLRGSTCVSQCQSGEVLMNNTYCQICVGSCLTCLSSNTSYCTSCLNSEYSLGGVCYSTCPSLYYGNSTSLTCIVCKLPCATCNSDTICLSCNPSTLFLVNYTCQSCSSPCLTCQSIQTNCTSCNTSSSFPFLFSSNCIASCPSTYYNDGSYNCAKCNSPCDTCSSSSNLSCITCQSGYSQLGSSCYLNCPSTYYSNGTYCLTCNLAICKTCTTTNDTCISCATGLYLYGSSCVGSCPSGLIVYNGSICLSCSGSCLTCLSSNSSYCTSCFTNSYLYIGNCLATCPDKFYPDSASGSCKTCQGLCLLCSSTTSCLSCLNPLLYLQNFSCVSSCTYPLIGINNVCYQCSSQCLTCVQNVSTCVLCATSFYYFPASFSCSLYCSFYILRASQSTSGNNQCTQTCPSGTYTDNSTQYCQTCPTGCKVCSSATNCSQCTSSYSYYSSFCYSPCPNSAPYSVNSTCIMCNIANCQACLNTTYCSTCQTNYLLIAQNGSSSCISSCATGYTYNSSLLSCIASTSSQNNTTSLASTVISSGLPPYSILIASASLVFISFIVKFKYPETTLSLIIFISLTITATCSLANLLYIELTSSGIMSGNMGQVSVSTYIILSSSGIQALSSLGCFIALLKIRDSGLVKQFHAYPITMSLIFILSLADSNILFLTLSQIMNFNCFKVKYSSESMGKVLKFSLATSIITKLLDIVYSGFQLNYYNANANRMLTASATYPINNAYTVQMIIISCMALAVIIYILYNMSKDQKVQNSKNDSNQSLIDDANAFDKRNSSNSELIFEIESSDMIVNINSLKDQNDLSLATDTKRLRSKKVTPDEMLEKMNNGIEQEQEQKEDTQDLNKDQKLQINSARNNENENEIEIQDINNVFYFEQQDTKQQNQINNEEKKAKSQHEEPQDNNKQAQHDNNHQSPEISDIIYNDHHFPQQPSNFLQNQIQAIQQAINEKTKTEIINIFATDDAMNEQEKHSPSRVSKYEPNKQIQQQFANSYLDDANKFNAHKQKMMEEEMQQSAKFINFQVDKYDFNQFQSIDEISFQNREDFATLAEPQHPPQERPDENNRIFKKNEWGQRQLQKQLEDIVEVPLYQPQEPEIIKIDEEESFREYTMEEKVTPSKNTFFQQEDEENQYKPSEGFKGKMKKHKKPDIPLPKNEIEKEIMSIYQKKEKKQPLPPRKKRYPDVPTQSKQSNYIQYSIEDKQFLEEKNQTKPIFSGQFKKQSRYNQSRSSSKIPYDDDQRPPEKPSVKLRKSSFKKIGEMVLDQSMQSARK